ncbi:hypothetical protein N7G274_003673 [Stereocaulon virgatum]|uniref:Uncharacterized protein n=1 Tax=Stereocaulon virgatum TaxID=373712 RepID=A0ABR4AFJ5_9LECA
MDEGDGRISTLHGIYHSGQQYALLPNGINSSLRTLIQYGTVVAFVTCEHPHHQIDFPTRPWSSITPSVQVPLPPSTHQRRDEEYFPDHADIAVPSLEQAYAPFAFAQASQPFPFAYAQSRDSYTAIWKET